MKLNSQKLRALVKKGCSKLVAASRDLLLGIDPVALQDTDHLVLHCPETRLEGGYQSVNNSNDDFKAWIKSKNVGV